MQTNEDEKSSTMTNIENQIWEPESGVLRTFIPDLLEKTPENKPDLGGVIRQRWTGYSISQSGRSDEKELLLDQKMRCSADDLVESQDVRIFQ